VSIATKFAKPTEITDARGRVSRPTSATMMPDRAAIPEDFRNPNSQNPWIKFQRDWFFGGNKEGRTYPGQGRAPLDEAAVWRHPVSHPAVLRAEARAQGGRRRLPRVAVAGDRMKAFRVRGSRCRVAVAVGRCRVRWV